MYILETDLPMLEIFPDIKKAANIPVIVAGGIVDGKDVARAISLGADGVQWVADLQLAWNQMEHQI